MAEQPEIKFEGKKKEEEKKKGFFAWLRSKLGPGGRNAMGGAGEGGAAGLGRAGLGRAGAGLGRAGAGAAGLGEAGAAGSGLGRAVLGASRFGASTGWLARLAAGNGGLLFGAAILAALGAGIYLGSHSGMMDGGAGAGSGSSLFSSNKAGGEYVPAIMRQQHGGGSSLDMLKDANKGLMEELQYDKDGYDQNGYDKDGYDRDGYDREGYDRDGYDREGYDRDGYDRNGYDRDGYNRDGYNKDGYNKSGGRRPGEGGFMSRLSSSLFSGIFGSSGGGTGILGGGNKYGTNNLGRSHTVIGGKTGAGRGTGAKKLSQADKGKKLLAMKGSKKGVITATPGLAGARGSGAWSQAQGVKVAQQAKTWSTGDNQTARATQDGAWENIPSGSGSSSGSGVITTPSGSSSGGSSGSGSGSSGSSGSSSGSSGSSSGSSGSSGSSSGSSGSSSGSSGSSSGSSGSSSGSSGISSSGSSSGSSGSGMPTVPDAVDASPWSGLVTKILALVVLAAALAIIGAAIIAASGWTGIGYAIGMAMCLAAFAAGAYALSLSTELISVHHQAALGALYMLGSGLAMASATVAMVGSPVLATTAMATWVAAAAGVCMLMGMMVG